MRKVIAFSALAIAAVLAVGIAAKSVTQSVLACRNVGGDTFADSGGNGGVGQTGCTATTGPATGTSGSSSDTGDWGSGVRKCQPGGTSNAVGCGHIGGSGSSSDKC